MTDAYLAYLERFFIRWLPVYDLFAATIAPAYARAARIACSADGSILDLATGTGQLALRCERRGRRAFGVDITMPMLVAARRRALGRERRLALARMDGRSLALPDRSVGTVLLGFALHDMPRAVRLEVLREALRVATIQLVVLDYAAPENPWLRRLWLKALALVETAYFPGFVRDGGVPELLGQLGVVGARRPALPGLAAVWVVDCADRLRP